MGPTSRYGSLVPFEKTAAHSGLYCGFPRAHLTLQTQNCIYATLRSILQAMLDQRKPPVAKEGVWKQFVLSGCRFGTSEELPSPYLERAFMGPPSVNASYFSQVARGRRCEADDHLWLLQTDPLYIQAVVQDFKACPAYLKMSKEVKKRVLAQEIILAPLMRAQRWQDIENECKYVEDTYHRFRDSISPAEKLPPRYERALCSLEHILTSAYRDARSIAYDYVMSEPAFSMHQDLLPSNNGEVGVQLKRFSKQDDGTGATLWRRDKLCWHVGLLSTDNNDQNFSDHALIQGSLQHLLERSSRGERARTSTRVQTHVSDVAAIHELITTLRLSQPRHDREIFNPRTPGEAELSRRYWRVNNQKAQLDKEQKSMLANLINKIAKVPIPKTRRSQNYFSSMIEARKQMTDL